MVRQQDFFKLSMDEMINLLYTEGTFIVSIRYYKHKVNLYLISDFYVEVFYNHKLDKLERVIPLERNIKRTKFYADQINLPPNLIDD